MATKANEIFKQAALHVRAVNHKLRQQIIELLTAKELTVTELYVKLRLEQSVASQHLAILRRSKIVSTRREGKFLYYSVNADRLKFLFNNCWHIVDQNNTKTD